MDDPLYTKPFIKKIITERKDDIVGVTTTKGNRLTISKNKSKTEYLFSLLLIMGLPFFIKNSLITLRFKLKKKFSSYGLGRDPSILAFANELNINTYHIKTPNAKSFLNILKEKEPDIIINQSQSILKAPLLSIPKIGTLNRHNALLPKNRGRLTPFWVLYKEEKETGVSIHFVEEGIDSGDIIVQEKYPVTKKDTFRTLVNKNYKIAPVAMLKAIDLLENGFTDFIPNDDEKASYNTTPNLKEAWHYRKKRFFKRK